MTGPFVHTFVHDVDPAEDFAVCGECLAAVPRGVGTYFVFTSTEVARMNPMLRFCRGCGVLFAGGVRR